MCFTSVGPTYKWTVQKSESGRVHEAPPQGPPLSTPSELHGAGLSLMYGIANAPGGWMRSGSLTAEQRVAAEGLVSQGYLEAYDAQDGRWYKLSPAGQHALWSAQSRRPIAQDCIGIHTHHDMGGDMVQRIHQHVAPQSAPQMAPQGPQVAGERLSYQDKQNLPDSAFALQRTRDLPMTDKYGRLDEKHVDNAAARLSMMWNEDTISKGEYQHALGRIQRARRQLGLPPSSLNEARQPEYAMPGYPGGRGAGRPQHLSYADIEQWVDNDEGLYDWWRSSGQSKRDFIYQNHAELVTAIENVRSGSRPEHHLKYGRGQGMMEPQRSGVVRQLFGTKPKPSDRPTPEQLAATFLSDIEEYEKTTWKDYINDERLPKIVAALTALGIKAGTFGPILGSGAFGTACAMDDGRVLKLTSDPTETQAAYILTGKNLPHVVRMYGSWFVRGVRINAVLAIRGGGPFEFGPVKKTRRKWPMGINIVERVQPLSHDWEAARGLSMTVRDYKREHDLWPEQIAKMGHERARQALKEASEGLEKTLRETADDLTRSNHVGDAKLANDVADALRETREQGVYAVDVHGGNVGSVLLPGNAYGGGSIPTKSNIVDQIANLDDWLSGQPEGELPRQQRDTIDEHLYDARRDARDGDWQEAGLDLHKARDAYQGGVRFEEFNGRIEEIVMAIRVVSQSENARANITYKIFDVGSSSPPPDPHAPTVPAPGKHTRKAGPSPEPDVHLGPEQLVFPGMLSEAPNVPWIGEGTDPLEVVPAPAPAVAATRKRKRA